VTLDRRAALGLVMLGGGLVLTAWAIYHLMRTGSCASGGVYVSARPCPPGTGLHVLGLMGSIFLALGGVGLARSPGLGVLWFGLFFTIIGSIALITDLVVMGIVFLATMGVPVVIGALRLAGGRSSSSSSVTLS
jgi:hypothetical protein